MDLQGLMNDMKLKLATEKIAQGIDEIRALGITREQILEGLRRQVDHQYEDASVSQSHKGVKKRHENNL